MAHPARQLPSKIYRGTVEDVFSHRSEIPPGAIIELKVFEVLPQFEPGRKDEGPASVNEFSKQLKGLGMLEGVLSTEEFLRSKHEDLETEDLPTG